MSEEQNSFIYHSTGEDEIDVPVLQKQNAKLLQENQKLRKELDGCVQQSTSYIFELQEEIRQFHRYGEDSQKSRNYNAMWQQENQELRENLDKNIIKNMNDIIELRQENQHLKIELKEKRGLLYLQLKDLEQENLWLQEELLHLKQKEDQKMMDNPKVIMKPKTDLDSVERIRLISQVAQADPSNIQQVGATQLKIINSYYESGLKQLQRSFHWSLICGGIGLVFLLFCVGVLLFRQATSVAVASGIAGTISEFLAGYQLRLYKDSSDQLAVFRESLESTQRLLLANSMCEQLEGETKQSIRADLIRQTIPFTIGHFTPIKIEKDALNTSKE